MSQKSKEKKAPVVIEPATSINEPIAPIQISPIQAMQQAKAAGFSVEEIREMLALQKEYEANEARKEFHKALAEFKKNPPRIVKDLQNKQYDNSDYTSIGNMVNTVSEALGPYGLHTRWDFPPQENNMIVCTCILAHRLGHEESVTVSGPIDDSGKKNPLQGRKSTRTYLKLETFEAVTGMASVSGNVDDDGNSAGKRPELITEEQSTELHARATDEGVYDAFMKFLGTMKIKSIDDIHARNYEQISKKLDISIESRKKEAEAKANADNT